MPLVLVLSLACAPGGLSKEEVTAFVTSTFQASNPAGRQGYEIKGKGVWFQAEDFQKTCLEEKDLAFNDNPGDRPQASAGVARISPTYLNQRFITASTPKGYCIYMGDDPKVEVKEVDSAGKSFFVKAAFTVSNPTPWWECLQDSFRNPTIQVDVSPDGEPTLPAGASLDLFAGDCPMPLPPGETRGQGTRPTAKPPKAPTAVEVKALVTAFDDALYAGDFNAALERVSCVNLVEKEKWGSCSVSELVPVGPMARGGEERPQDGTPWLEYAVASFDDFGRIVPDKDPTLFHVTLTHKRTKRPRSFGVQWQGGTWKMFGVVDSKAEGLTAMRFLYDLDDRARRDIFEKRLKGEEIDEHGKPLDPYFELKEEERKRRERAQGMAL